MKKLAINNCLCDGRDWRCVCPRQCKLGINQRCCDDCADQLDSIFTAVWRWRAKPCRRSRLALQRVLVRFYYELLYSAVYVAPKQRFLVFRRCLHGATLGLREQYHNSFGRLVPANRQCRCRSAVGAGTTDSIVLVGWSADLGTSWGTVSNELANGSYQTVLAGQQGFFGVSTTGYTTTFDTSTSPGATLFATCCECTGPSDLLSKHAVVSAAGSRTRVHGVGWFGRLVADVVPSSTQISWFCSLANPAPALRRGVFSFSVGPRCRASANW